MDAEDAAISRVVWLSQAITLLILIALVATFTVTVISHPATWLGMIVGLALAQPAIVWWVRRAEPPIRARALRRASLVVTPLALTLFMPFAVLDDPSDLDLARWAAIAPAVVVFAAFGAAFADLAIARIIPASWRAGDRPMWSPQPNHLKWLALAWPLATLLVFMLSTAVTGDSSCAEDGRCRFGIPLEFVHFGGREGGRRVEWDRLWSDVAIFATIIPAAYGLAASRLRLLFAIYLIAILTWLGAAAVSSWGGWVSWKIWWELVLGG